MKPRVVLLCTRDHTFDRVLSEALHGSGAIVLMARNVATALPIVGRQGRELDLAVIDFTDGCRGMVLLSALHTYHQQLPILVTTSTAGNQSTELAYANGARACLSKPLPAATLANIIADLELKGSQPVAA